jgi:general stress protein 26
MKKDEFAVRQQLWDLVKDIKFGMFTTRHPNGHLHSRPMTTQNSRLDDDATLWFFMSRQGEAMAELLADPSVCMVYADTGKDSYVSISGRAVESTDRAAKERLWSPMAKAWFPGGIDDADLALVRLDISHADYWDVKESKLVQLWRMASAAVTGKPPTDLGEHQHLQVR